MTIEIYRPGVAEPLKIQDGEFFDGNVPDSAGSSILLQGLGTGMGFKQYFTDAIHSYSDFIRFDKDQEDEDPGDREKLEDQYIRIPKGVSVQLADSIIAKAT